MSKRFEKWDVETINTSLTLQSQTSTEYLIKQKFFKSDIKFETKINQYEGNL